MSLKKKHHYHYVFWCRCIARVKDSCKLGDFEELKLSEEVKKFSITFELTKCHLNTYDIRRLEEKIRDRLSAEENLNIEKIFIEELSLVRKKRIG